jgi:hypothetical protein
MKGHIIRACYVLSLVTMFVMAAGADRKFG